MVEGEEMSRREFIIRLGPGLFGWAHVTRRQFRFKPFRSILHSYLQFERLILVPPNLEACLKDRGR